MAALATGQITQTGLVTALVAAAAGGDTMETGPTNFLHVKAGATGVVVTVDSVAPCSQGGDHNVAVTVSANTERFIGPITERFAQPANGRANVTYDQVTTITAEAVRI